MAIHIKQPSRVKSAGNKVKIIDEFIGHVNCQNSDVSIAKMQSPPGWEEPAQTPEFDEYTIVLKGSVHIKTDTDHFIIKEGEAFISKKGEKIQYSTPDPEGAEYIAVCLPAFTPQSVNRKE
jgi:mannose-6-phosphate isomerase-like protein (cupin superfamily)